MDDFLRKIAEKLISLSFFSKLRNLSFFLSIIVCNLGSTTQIESSHARIQGMELHVKGSPVNNLTNTVEARLCVGSLIQNTSQGEAYKILCPSTSDSNIAVITKRAEYRKSESQRMMTKRKINLCKRIASQAQFTDKYDPEKPVYKKLKTV